MIMLFKIFIRIATSFEIRYEAITPLHTYFYRSVANYYILLLKNHHYMQPFRWAHGPKVCQFRLNAFLQHIIDSNDVNLFTFLIRNVIECNFHRQWRLDMKKLEHLKIIIENYCVVIGFSSTHSHFSTDFFLHVFSIISRDFYFSIFSLTKSAELEMLK